MATKTTSQIIGIRMDEATLKVLDELVDTGLYKSRSGCIKALIYKEHSTVATSGELKKKIIERILSDKDVIVAINTRIRTYIDDVKRMSE